MRNELNLSEKAFIAAKIYSSMSTYFAHWDLLPNMDLDVVYKNYLRLALDSNTRFEFDLLTIEFIALLNNGHSDFFDDWLWENYGQQLGFYAYPTGEEWVVLYSFIDALRPGDIITEVDGQEIEQFFQVKKRYISASSERSARIILFRWDMGILFPMRFTLTLACGKSITIDRREQKNGQLSQKPQGKWLTKDSIGFIKIPSFADPKYEEAAIKLITKYRTSNTLVIDLRGNGGGTSPVQLTDVLMDRPYRLWAESSPLSIPVLGVFRELAKDPNIASAPPYSRGFMAAMSDVSAPAKIVWTSEFRKPAASVFVGQLMFLVDGRVCSAAEDFLIPFKDNGRAIIIGETTQGSSGQPYKYDFQNGMAFRISSKRSFFPSGAEFEGVGVQPDVEVAWCADDLRLHRDAALEIALELAVKTTK